MYPASRSNILEARCTSEVHSGQETYESLQALRIIRRVMVKVIVGSQRKKTPVTVSTGRVLSATSGKLLFA